MKRVNGAYSWLSVKEQEYYVCTTIKAQIYAYIECNAAS